MVLFVGWKGHDAGTFHYSEGSPSTDVNQSSPYAYSGTIGSHPASSCTALRYDRIA